MTSFVSGNYTLNIENNLEYHVLDIQSDEDYQLGEVSDRRYFINRVLDIAYSIQFDLDLDESKDYNKIEAALLAEGYEVEFIPIDHEHTRATITVRIEGNTATINITDRFFIESDNYTTIAYFVTESGVQLSLQRARETLLSDLVSITIEGMDPSQLPDEVTIRRKTLTRNGNTYTFRASVMPPDIFSFYLNDLIRELDFSDSATYTIDMENRSAVITVEQDTIEQDFTFPLPRGHSVQLLKDGFLYTYGNDILKMYDVNLRAEVLSLQMPKFKSVVAQGDHFAVSYTGGFKVYRKFFVDNEYEVDLKYEVNDMGWTYLALRGNTMVAYDDKDDNVRIYRFGTVKEFSIDNGDDCDIIIGDTHIYSYDSYDTINIYNFKGERVKTFEFDAEIMKVQYHNFDGDDELYITAKNQGMTQTIILDLDSGARTTTPNLETYIYDNRIYKIYEDEVKLDGQLIYETQHSIDKFFASGGYMCIVDSQVNALIIQNTSIIKNGTQWVDGDITYTVTAVSGDFVTMSDGSEVSLVVNKVDLLKDFRAKVEEGFDWDIKAKYSNGNAIEANDIVEYEGEKWEVKSFSGTYIEVRKGDKTLKLQVENVEFLSRALKYSSGERVLPADTFVKDNEKYIVYAMTMDMVVNKEVSVYVNPYTENVDYSSIFIEGARLESRNSFHYENGKKMEVGDRIKQKLLFRLNPGSSPPAIEAEVIAVVRKLPRLNEESTYDPQYSGGEIVYRHPFYPRRSTRPFTANDVVVTLNFQGKTERYPGTDDFIEEGDSVSYDGYGDVVLQCTTDKCVILAQSEIAKTSSITLIKRSPIHAVPGIAYSIEDFLNPLLIMPEERILFEDPTEPPEEPDLTEKRFKNVEERIAYIKKQKEEDGCVSLNNTGNRVYPVKFIIGESKGNPVYDIKSDKLLFVFCAETLKEYWIKNRSANGINPLNRNEVKYVVFMTQEEVNEQEEILKTQISSKPVPAQAPVKVSFKDNITKIRINQMKELIKTTEGKLSGKIPLDKDEDGKETEDIESLKKDLEVYREKLKSYLKQMENPRLRLETYKTQLLELREEKMDVERRVEAFRRGQITLTEEEEWFLTDQYNSFRSTNRRLNPVYKMEDLIEQLEREIEEQERQKNKRSGSSGGGGKRQRQLKF